MVPSVPPVSRNVDYPSSDGLPMAESDFQREPLIYAVEALRIYFQGRQDVYVSGNLFIYYEEGNPQAAVAPDVFVAFVFARAADGPPMPLAAVRRPAGDFPVEITLDDSRSMLPSLKLSGFDAVLVGARVSAGGGPLAQPGDLEATPQALQLTGTPGPSAVSLTIDRVVQ